MSKKQTLKHGLSLRLWLGSGEVKIKVNERNRLRLLGRLESGDGRRRRIRACRPLWGVLGGSIFDLN